MIRPIYLSVSLCLLLQSAGFAQESPQLEIRKTDPFTTIYSHQPRRSDVGKGAIERPLEGSILSPWQVTSRIKPVSYPKEYQYARAPIDVRKSFVERPLENSIAPVPKLKDVVTDAAAGKVQPGLVRWHGSMEAAKVASAKSGKPVFLFTMMGKLDEKFC